MRRILMLLATTFVTTQGAHAQAVMMPADSDLRAMQAPIDWEGSRAQHTQDGDPGAARWSASAAVPPAEMRAVAPPAAAAAVMPQDRPDFRVDVWDKDDRVVETMAHCATLSVGRAAFKEAAKERPGQKITLRRDATVVASREAAAR